MPKFNKKECNKEDFRPDWDDSCLSCESSPTVPFTGLCGPCTFGQAETVAGGWWDEENGDFSDIILDGEIQ